MLTPEEFTAGGFDVAPVGSLILPRSKYDEVAIVGHFEEAKMAVFLSGQFRFQSTTTTDAAANWSGLIIPNVRMEVDESTAFNPNEFGSILGSVVRIENKLIINSSTNNNSSRAFPITLVSKVSETTECDVGFTSWQVVLGSGIEKRILIKIDSRKPSS